MELSHSAITVILSAAFVGFIHSLSPAHWMPVVLVSKSKKWNLTQSVLGALVSASGHIFISILLGVIGITAELHLLSAYEYEIERYSSLILVLFGVLYALFAWKNHRHCKEHAHHGPKPRASLHSFLFLFLIGFAPCVAALPLFFASAYLGSLVIVLTLVSFSVGVIAALMTASILFYYGLMKLDHPVFEHYSEVITGVLIALVGVLLFLFMQEHTHGAF